MPSSFYEAPPIVEWPGGSPVVHFEGEDGRSRRYVFAGLPLPGLHPDFAVGLARRVGPGGGRRTDRAATCLFQGVGRFLRALASPTDPPQRLQDLRVGHIDRFRMVRLETCSAVVVVREIRDLFSVFDEIPDRTGLDPDLADFLARRNYATGVQSRGLPGYSDREFAAIMAAARSDAAEIRDRVMASELLLQRFRDRPETLSAEERRDGHALSVMAETGLIDRNFGKRPILEWLTDVTRMTSRLFLTIDDLTPLLVLAVGLTGRNPETIKELPAEHRVLEDRVVEMTLTKRRRGKEKSRQTATWEIARDPGRQLRSPGSYYLLLHQLTARSRGSPAPACCGRSGQARAAARPRTGTTPGMLVRSTPS